MRNNPGGAGEEVGGKAGLLLPAAQEEELEEEDKSKLSPPPSYKAVVYSASRGKTHYQQEKVELMQISEKICSHYII